MQICVSQQNRNKKILFSSFRFSKKWLHLITIIRKRKKRKLNYANLTFHIFLSKQFEISICYKGYVMRIPKFHQRASASIRPREKCWIQIFYLVQYWSWLHEWEAVRCTFNYRETGASKATQGKVGPLEK